jgi:hypothetical protein
MFPIGKRKDELVEYPLRHSSSTNSNDSVVAASLMYTPWSIQTDDQILYSMYQESSLSGSSSQFDISWQPTPTLDSFLEEIAMDMGSLPYELPSDNDNLTHFQE